MVFLVTPVSKDLQEPVAYPVPQVFPVHQVDPVTPVHVVLQVNPTKVRTVNQVNPVNQVTQVLPAEVHPVHQAKQSCPTSKPSSTLYPPKLTSISTPPSPKTSEANPKESNTTFYSTTTVKATEKNKVASSRQPTVSTFSRPTHYDVKTLVNCTSTSCTAVPSSLQPQISTKNLNPFQLQ